MSKLFRERGISFRYPDSWTLEHEEADNGWTVTVQSPGTAIVIVRLDEDMPETQQVAETTLEALRSEYPGLEAEARVDTLAGQMAVGHDIHFFSLDLTNTCWTRSIDTDHGTLLVLWQAADLDLDEYEPELKRLCASLKVEQD